MRISDFIKRRFRIFRKEVLVLYFALRHPATPLLPKVLVLLTLAYLISPFDAIPDFIPFVGYLDDVVLVPFLINTSFKMLPLQVKEYSAERAGREAKRLKILFTLALILLVILLVWLFIGIKDAIQHLLQ